MRDTEPAGGRNCAHIALARLLLYIGLLQDTVTADCRMTVLNMWDGLCHQLDNKTGEWRRVRIIVGRRVLHVVPASPALPASSIFHCSVSFKLNKFKLEVS